MNARDAIERARERWGCRGVGVPLVVTAHLEAPLACDALPLVQPLDSALEWAALYATVGDPSSLLWPREGCGLLPSPIASVTLAGWEIARCSRARMPVAREDRRKRRRRTDAEQLGLKGRVVTGGGVYKCLDLPVLTVVAPLIEWRVRADHERLRELLAGLHSLGRNGGAGLGAVTQWTLEDDPYDASLEHKGHPTRPLPVASCEEACKRYGDDVPLDTVAVRGPYWHRQSRTLAALPC